MKRIFELMLLVLLCAGSAQAQFNFSRFVVSGEAGLARGLNVSGDRYVPYGEVGVQHKIFPNWLFGRVDFGYTNLKAPQYWTRTGFAVYELVIVPANGRNFYPFLSAGGGAGKSIYSNGTAFYALTKFGIGSVTRISDDFIMQWAYNYFLTSDKLDGITRSSTNVNPLANGRYDAFQVFHAGIGIEFGPRRNAKRNADRELLGLEAPVQERVARRDEPQPPVQEPLFEAQSFEQLLFDDTTAVNLPTELPPAVSPAPASPQRESTVLIDRQPVSTAAPWRWFTFESRSAELSEDAKMVCNEVVTRMKRNPGLTVTIAGHTDDLGSAAGNMRASLLRANNVKEYLMALGIEGERISTIGKGETEPKHDNMTPEGRALNRRVEFWPGMF